MFYTRRERRTGNSERRKANKMKQLVLFSVFFMIGAAAGGLIRGDLSTPELPAGPDPLVMRNIDAVREDIQRLASVVPDTVIRYVTRTATCVPDTIPVPYAVPSEPQIVEVASPPVVVHDTTIIYREAKIQMCPERTFWSSETYRPSVGNTVWSLGGFLLGAFVGGQVNNDARACVVINGEEVCNY